MTGRYNAYTGNRPLKWQISVPKARFELFGRNRFWWVTCVLSYTLWDLGVSIAPPHPSALATEWLAVLTAPKSLSYCTTFPTLTQERGDRKQRKRDLLHEIRNPSTLGMHESVDECGLEWLEARLPKHLKSKLEHPLCNVTNNKPNK